MVNYGIHWHNNDSFLCFMGGILVGAVAAARMLIFGKVTGIAGIVGGVIKMPLSFSYDRIARFAFVCGLVIGGVTTRKYIPAAFEDWSTLPTIRLVMAGLLVGFGTTLGNGCTSGHGVCGISSFRMRSLIATCTFMLAGFVASMSTNTASYLPFFINTLPVGRSAAIIGVCIIVCVFMTAASHFIRTHLDTDNRMFHPDGPIVQIFVFIFELIFGISFSLAMGVSNMTKISATISFLDLRYWNPALAFVMCGAIFVAATSFLIIRLKRDMPLLDVEFYKPVFNQVDAKLITGSVIFGVGWGLAGACPGPAMTNLGSGNIPPVIYCSCMVAGMLLEHASAEYMNTHIFKSANEKKQSGLIAPAVMPQQPSSVSDDDDVCIFNNPTEVIDNDLKVYDC